MGVGIPGMVDSEEGIIIQSAALGWHGLQIKEVLEPHFPFPVFCENDVNCAAYGEKWLGSGKQANDLLFITIGTGLGAAIIANGNLIRGHSFGAGEIGYFISKEDVQLGKKHSLDEFGLFERKVAGQGLDTHIGSAAILFDLFNKNDPSAIEIVNDFILELSVAIANCVSLLNSEIVVIGGGVSHSMHTIIDLIQDIVSRYSPMPIQVRLAQLGEEAGGIGAVGLAFQYIQEI
jgi:glucokinase